MIKDDEGTRSSDHPTVRAFREKMDSIAEHTAPELAAVVARVRRLKAKSDPPPEKTRPGGESAVPVEAEKET